MQRVVLFLRRATVRWSLRPIHYIFAVALIVRAFALTRLAASPFLLPTRGDMYFYNDWAQRILHGHFTDHQAFYGLPLYAYLLAALYRLFGYSPFIPGVLQALLEAGTSALIYKIATHVFANDKNPKDSGEAVRFAWSNQSRGRLIGYGAALGWVFCVPAQAYSVILMPTSWLIFVFWYLVWQVVRRDRAIGTVAALGFGVLVGVTAMGIATILFIVPLLVAAILLRPAFALDAKPAAAFWAKLTAIALLFAGLGLGTSPCWLHNYFFAHDRVTLSAHSGINFWIGNNPIANGYPRFPPGLRAGQAAMLQDSISVAEAAAGRPLKRSEVSAYWSSKAANFIRENPFAWLRLMARKLANFWNAFQYDDLSIITNLRDQEVVVPGPSFGLIAAFALPGLLFAFKQFRRSRWIAAAVVLHMASLLSVFVTERYRLAAVPGLLIFASFGIWLLWKNVMTGEYRPALAYLAFLTIATWFVSRPQTDPSLWALDAYNSGWQALESNNLSLAQKKLELARAYVPENAEINLALGNLWMERRQPAKAEAFYRATLAIEPKHKSALNNLGVLELRQHHVSEAEHLFRTALGVQANDPKTHYLLAEALLQNGDRTEALAEAETAVRLKSDQPEFITLRDGLLRTP